MEKIEDQNEEEKSSILKLQFYPNDLESFNGEKEIEQTKADIVISAPNKQLTSAIEMSERGTFIHTNQDLSKTINEAGSFTCEICYSEIQQIKALKFKCGHQFCIDCVKEQLIYLIENGQIKQLQCAQFECGEQLLDSDIE